MKEAFEPTPTLQTMMRPPTPRPTRRAVLATALVLGGCATGLGERLPGPPRARVVLFRGIADLSTGLDEFAQALREAGYSASVHNHLAGEAMESRLVGLARQGRLPRPLCLGGHSLGADTAIAVSGELWSARIATDALFTIDPVLVGRVPGGPRHVANFYQAHNGFGRPLAPGPGFGGEIENIDLDGRPGLGHFGMDRDPNIRREIVARIEALRQA